MTGKLVRSVPVGSLEQSREILESLRDVPRMHKIVEVLWLKLVRFCVVDHELDVWGYPDGLDGTQINTQDLC